MPVYTMHMCVNKSISQKVLFTSLNKLFEKSMLVYDDTYFNF